MRPEDVKPRIYHEYKNGIKHVAAVPLSEVAKIARAYAASKDTRTRSAKKQLEFQAWEEHLERWEAE